MVEGEDGGENPTPGSHLPASLAGLKFSRKFNFSAQSDLQRDDGRPPSRSLSALLNDVSVTLFIFSRCFFFLGAAASITAEILRREEKERSERSRR